MSELSASALPPGLERIQQRLAALRRQGAFHLSEGRTGTASAPSNIALLKYWGKVEGATQVPSGSSASLTLGGFRSSTRVRVRWSSLPGSLDAAASRRGSDEDGTGHRFRLSRQDDPAPGPLEPAEGRLRRFLDQLRAGWADDVAFDVTSSNSFPTACGIASSASGFAALVGAMADLLDLDRWLSPGELEFWLAEWARLGSGSATRSTARLSHAHFVGWERLEADEPAGRSGLWEGAATRTRVLEAAPSLSSVIEHRLYVVDARPKAISSSEGHRSAGRSPLQKLRLASIPYRYRRLAAALRAGDFDEIREITEDDAFAMHAVMQATLPQPGYLAGQTVALIELFIGLRDAHRAPALWTLDAGPNLHVISLPGARACLEELEHEARARGILAPALINHRWSGLELGGASEAPKGAA